MVLSYGYGVAVVSLAIFGFWCLLKDLWSWAARTYLYEIPRVSFLVVVREIEQDIEEMLRHLVFEIELADAACDVIVLDRGSEDLTLRIAERLAAEYPAITALSAREAPTVDDALPYCRGTVIYLLDASRRIAPDAFIGAAAWLLGETRR